ncbi:4'-phosphopantetheinyl transferase family protein [Peribacillus butanolivorans]|uniref:4'-phosphopantetheinyl transferase family protein n=1 Tax=Peribacillus butanolivorans TaxID=421767 RepID=UPI0036DDD481
MVRLLAINTNIEIPNNVLQYFYSFIPEQKINRLERFRIKQDKYNSLLGEVLIRTYISRIYRIPPQDIEIYLSKNNKPYINNIQNLHFNISHSNHWVICCISHFPIGIDIEEIIPIDFNIARDFFSENEYLDLMSFKDSEKKLDYFYALWTLKEAYTKYLGTGITIPLDSFSFSIDDKEIRLNTQDSGPLHFYQSKLTPNYIFSVCIEESDFDPSPKIYTLTELME